MKNEKKNLHGFLYTKNMANFEAFRIVISSSINVLFQKNETSNQLHRFLSKTLILIDMTYLSIVFQWYRYTIDGNRILT